VALALRLPAARPALEPLYFFGEYVFAASILAGCQSLARGARPGRRWVWAALGLVAMATSQLHAGFAVRLIPHTAIVTAILAGGVSAALRVPRAGSGRIGARLLQLSLIALAALFAHYVPVLGWAAWTGNPMPGFYARYGPILQLLAETLLGFSTLIVVMEREHRDLELANDELRAAREKLETMARVDPLTASLNRHAFYSMIGGRRTTAESPGCVGVVDLDALKPINDTFGHAAGDAAIRAVARAIRQVVRADDLVFRWGGDEFLIVLFGVSEAEAGRRLEGLDAMLTAVPVPGSADPIALTVSFGVAAFAAVAGLEAALEQADERMYRRKPGRASFGRGAR